MMRLSKIAIFVVVCLIIAGADCYAADAAGMVNNKNMQQQQIGSAGIGVASPMNGVPQMQNIAPNMPAYGAEPNIQEDEAVSITCASYDECIEEYGKFTPNQRKQVALIYNNNNIREYKYSLFDSLILKISSNTCPLVMDVYKKVNNINYLMDIYQLNDNGECATYYANISGDGTGRDTVVGQIEIHVCNKNGFSNDCSNSVILTKINTFSSK